MNEWGGSGGAFGGPRPGFGAAHGETFGGSVTAAGGGGTFGPAADGGGGTFGSTAGGGGVFGPGHSGGGGTFGAAPSASGGATLAAKPLAWDPTVTGIACGQLRDAVAAARIAVTALRTAPDLAVAAAPGVSVVGLRRCGAELDAREAAVHQLADELERLHDDTMLAGRAYEWASDAVRGLIEQVVGGAAYAFGAALRTAGLAAASWAVAIGLVAVPLAARLLLTNPQVLARVMEQAEQAGLDLQRFLAETSGFWERAGEVLMANPLFVSALALAVESTDEMLAGMLGVPAPVAAEFESEYGDDEVFGFLTLILAAGVGKIAGTGRVHPVFSRPVAPLDEPVTESATAMRIILEQDEQVTIQTFRMDDGSLRHQVFVRGTQTVLPSGSSGLDMQANVENAASLDNLPGRDGMHGSDAAVAEAMRAAGVRPGDAVDLFGFSQGAGAVANVAASGEFNVQTALLVGGPVAAADIPPDVAVYSIAHHGDIVPPLDGWSDEPGTVHTTMVESAGGHGTGPMARHSGLEYVETLETADDFVHRSYQERLIAGTEGGVGVAAVSVHLRRR